MKHELSIIIPAYQAEKTLSLGLDSLFRQIHVCETPEIVVVNSSQPDIDDVLRQRFPSVNFIQSPQRLHPGAARNTGVEQTEGRFLAFLDADAMPQPGWLEHVYKAASAPETVLTGGPLINGQPDNLAAQVNHTFEYSDFLPGRPGGPRRFLPSGNLVCSRTVFESIGPFSDSLSGCEDVVFGERAKKAGLRLIIVPEMAVVIMNRTTLSDVFRHAYQLGISAGQARRTFSLSGSWIRWCPPALPGLLFYRFSRLLTISLRCGSFQRHQLLKGLPALNWAIALWSIGFARGLWWENRQPRNIAL